MNFQTAAGTIDIQANDIVQIQDSILPTPPTMAGYLSVLSVSGSNLTQVQVQYQDEADTHSVWLDALWILGNLRPILPS